MNNRTAKAARKAAGEASRQTAALVMPDFATLARDQHGLARAMDILTDYAEKTEKLAQELASWRGRSFLGRLGWLLLGK